LRLARPRAAWTNCSYPRDAKPAGVGQRDRGFGKTPDRRILVQKDVYNYVSAAVAGEPLFLAGIEDGRLTQPGKFEVSARDRPDPASVVWLPVREQHDERDDDEHERSCRVADREARGVVAHGRSLLDLGLG
jgi:hypothetical protein